MTEWMTCPWCNGKGTVSDGKHPEEKPCGQCGGTGRIEKL